MQFALILHSRRPTLTAAAAADRAISWGFCLRTINALEFMQPTSFLKINLHSKDYIFNFHITKGITVFLPLGGTSCIEKKFLGGPALVLEWAYLKSLKKGTFDQKFVSCIRERLLLGWAL